MASQSLKVTKTRKLSGINCPCCGQNIAFSSLSGSLDVHVAEMNPKTRAAVRDINKMKQLHKKIARRRLKAFYRRGRKIRVSAPGILRTFEQHTHDLEVPQKSQMPDNEQNAVACTSSKQYQYQPLENNGTIRILILHPGKQSDQLVGTIEVVPIQSAVPYETMSYVWADSGPPKHAGTMVIRGRGNEDALLALRGGSIVAALHQLRRPDRPRRIWTDQCCINQDDLEERSKQVQFMDQIYRNSTHVLVWLGSDTENEAASAFDTVRKLDKILEEPPADGRGSDRQKTDLASYIIANQKSLQALTKCTWVGRESEKRTIRSGH